MNARRDNEASEIEKLHEMMASFVVREEMHRISWDQAQAELIRLREANAKFASVIELYREQFRLAERDVYNLQEEIARIHVALHELVACRDAKHCGHSDFGRYPCCQMRAKLVTLGLLPKSEQREAEDGA